MAGKMDKSKLASAIMGVGAVRASGVEKGHAVNAEPQGKGAPVKMQSAVEVPTEAPAPASAEASAPAKQGRGAVSQPGETSGGAGSVTASSEVDKNKTARVTFLCTPKDKKHLKMLAYEQETDVSKLIYEALKKQGLLAK